MDELKTKQQIVERIQKAEKILVTVSNDPSVDALSAALGLTLLLDSQEKYVTAIYSGQTPPAIAFLQPEQTFDDTTDSLRDFIIALNKDKADHLRYKVEGDSVKIFITPYKTTITDKDLEFSQGDYNIELVIALGVDKQEHLDGALAANGQILHDADIITVSAGTQTSDLGGIDWHDDQASSLSEMVVGLAEAMKTDKNKSLLDATSATALLTGIVAQTDRFSNEHTTSKVMQVAAALMGAGADQQLIATELRHANQIDDTLDVVEGKDASEKDADENTEASSETPEPKNSLSISHKGETLADLDKRVRGEKKSQEKADAELEALEEDAESLAKKYPLVDDAPVAAQTPATIQPAEPALGDAVGNAYALDEADQPSLGGTLNATTEQAAEDARQNADDEQNKTILSHSYLGGSATQEGGTNTDGPVGFPSDPEVAPGSQGVNSMPIPTEIHSAYALDEHGDMPTDTAAPSVADAQALAAPAAPAVPEMPPVTAMPSEPSVAVGGERVIQPLHPTPTDLGLPLPPPLPDFSSVGITPPPAIPLPPTQQPEILGDILAPEAPAPTAAPEVPQSPAAPVDPSAPTGTDPGQFKIPGQ